MRRSVRLAKCRAIEIHCALVMWSEEQQQQRVGTQNQQEASPRRARSHIDAVWVRAGVLLQLQKLGEAKE